jgi:hypothetical protein
MRTQTGAVASHMHVVLDARCPMPLRSLAALVSTVAAPQGPRRHLKRGLEGPSLRTVTRRRQCAGRVGMLVVTANGRPDPTRACTHVLISNRPGRVAVGRQVELPNRYHRCGARAGAHVRLCGLAHTRGIAGSSRPSTAAFPCSGSGFSSRTSPSLACTTTLLAPRTSCPGGGRGCQRGAPLGLRPPRRSQALPSESGPGRPALS